MGPVWQNPLQRTVRTAHPSVLMTVHSFSTQYNTEQFWWSPLLPPDGGEIIRTVLCCYCVDLFVFICVYFCFTLYSCCIMPKTCQNPACTVKQSKLSSTCPVVETEYNTATKCDVNNANPIHESTLNKVTALDFSQRGTCWSVTDSSYNVLQPLLICLRKRMRYSLEKLIASGQLVTADLSVHWAALGELPLVFAPLINVLHFVCRQHHCRTFARGQI